MGLCGVVGYLAFSQHLGSATQRLRETLKRGQKVAAREIILGKVITQIKSSLVYLISSEEFVPLCTSGCGQYSPFVNDNKNGVHLAVLALVGRLARHVRPSKQQPCVIDTKMLLGHGSTGHWLHWPLD